MQIQLPTKAALPGLEKLRPDRPSVATAGERGSSATSSAPRIEREGGLWEVLTPDEQAFFQEQHALGPLTYGRRAASAAGAPTGQRLDVRA